MCVSPRVFTITRVFVSNYKGRGLRTVSIGRDWVSGGAGGLVLVRGGEGTGGGHQELEARVCVFRRCEVLGDS